MKMRISENFEHTSVLLQESIEGLDIKTDGIYLDGTVGGAGHSSEIIKRLSKEGLLIALDKDDDALEVANERLKNVDSAAGFELFKANFADFEEVLSKLNVEKLDGIILDLGVSSWQLDEAERGFSYMNDGPLDMRMDNVNGESAAELLARIDEASLAELLFKYGEERNSRRIAESIIWHRENIAPISRTKDLAEIIIKAQPTKSRREKQHPAKRAFQALRIYVNKELQDLENFLDKAPDYVNAGGRICIITFHSLEDRLVKQAFRNWEDPCICPNNLPVPCVCGKKTLGTSNPRNGVVADQLERVENPRSRSARLRSFVRNSNPRI